MILQPVSASFFELPTQELAQALLGMVLVKTTRDGTASGWIVETESYIGPEDRAAHSYGNRRTPRTEVMFGPAGHAYTYEMHTHCLLNVVSGRVNQPEVVLIRAIEPYTGIHLMRERRGPGKTDRELTNGPGKLTKALGITKADYGHPLFEEPLYIASGKHIDSIAIGPRIGIDNSGDAKHYPWRYWEHQNPFVSKPVTNVTEIRYM
ncbi:DNA-3-methyladenine glycosylase [Paenibacillus sp. GCM10027626]|uniref:DNA-3-methyladenine glycosylase n=1 Tax=Paenibacillus sp. GCM10027626 TaxID=3273411 RepID=UPI00363F9C8D